MGPAEQLKGMILKGEWTVIDFAKRRPNATGGHFSHGYIVEHRDGHRGFLKALDYTAAMLAPNTPVVLNALSTSYIFEKSLCEKTAHLSRITRAIDSGNIHVNKADPFSKVEYLIFELADHDIRAHLDLLVNLDTVFVFNALHHVAIGLGQLHRAAIAHQDLKPSNVLIYGANGSKICDMGRAWDRNMPAIHDAYEVAGDLTYAPVDALYHHLPVNEFARCFGCDLYHLGSLVIFCFARVNATAMLLDNMDPLHRPVNWGGSYTDVLPFVQAAMELSLIQFAQYVPEYCRDELKQIVVQLCNPDPGRRGHPMTVSVNQYSLERYISRFNALAHRARLALK